MLQYYQGFKKNIKKNIIRNNRPEDFEIIIKKII